MKQQILNDFLGQLTIVNYIVAFAFVFLALILKWTWKTLDSVKNNPKTPDKFTWSYWWRDNAYPKIVSCLSVLIAVFIILRFCNEITGRNFSYFIALVVGLYLDSFIHKLKKMAPYLVSKQSLDTNDVKPITDPSNPPQG